MATKRATQKAAAPAAPPQRRIIELDPATVRVVAGRNKRIDMGDVAELAQSIRENGMREPATVLFAADGVPELVNGHRRHAACMRLVNMGIQPLFPAIEMDANATEADVLVTMLVTNTSKPFAPLEEALMFEELKEQFQYTHEQIAQRLGCSVSHIANRLALLRSAPELQQAVRDGAIGISDADTIAKKTHGDHDRQRELVEEVKQHGPGVVQKKLKAGRLPKHQWDVVIDMYDRLYGSLQTIRLAGLDANVEQRLTDTAYLDAVKAKFHDDAELEFLWQYAQLAAAADMAGVSVTDLIARCTDKLTGPKPARD